MVSRSKLASCRQANRHHPSLKKRYLLRRLAEQIVYGDKVICVRNHKRAAYNHTTKSPAALARAVSLELLLEDHREDDRD